MGTPFLTLGDLSIGAGPDSSGIEFTLEMGSLQGWDAPASTVAPVQRVRAHGSWAGEAFARGRVISWQGLISAPDEAGMWAARDMLNAACTLADTVVTVHEAGRDRWTRARRSDEVLVRTITPTLARYSVQMVALDSRLLGAELSADTALPSSVGGLRWPVRWPVRWPGSTIAGQVSLTNPGPVAGPVRLRIDGPVSGPIVTHVSTGARLVFATSVVLGAGEFLTVDMDTQEVLAQGSQSRAGWVTEPGFSAFEPGVNTWAFTAAAHDPAALLTVYATPAW